MSKLEKFVCTFFLMIFLYSLTSCGTTNGCGYWSSKENVKKQTEILHAQYGMLENIQG